MNFSINPTPKRNKDVKPPVNHQSKTSNHDNKMSVHESEDVKFVVKHSIEGKVQETVQNGQCGSADISDWEGLR